MSSRAAKSITDSLDDLLMPENQHLIPEEWKKSLFLLSFRYIGDTLGYDRCCHVSEAYDGLWVADPGI